MPSIIAVKRNPFSFSCFPLFEMSKSTYSKVYGSVSNYKGWVREYSYRSLYPVHDEDGNTDHWEMYDPGATHLSELDSWYKNKKDNGYSIEWCLDES